MIPRERFPALLAGRALLSRPLDHQREIEEVADHFLESRPFRYQPAGEGAELDEIHLVDIDKDPARDRWGLARFLSLQHGSPQSIRG